MLSVVSYKTKIFFMKKIQNLRKIMDDYEEENGYNSDIYFQMFKNVCQRFASTPEASWGHTKFSHKLLYMGFSEYNV